MRCAYLGFIHPALCLVLVGCDQKKTVETPTATVSGKVSLPGGKPLPGGRITFESVTASNKLGTGEIRADGTYEAVGVPQGDCKVSIENGFLKPLANPTSADVKPDPSLKYAAIDAKYARTDTSKLTTTVTDQAHTYDIELK